MNTSLSASSIADDAIETVRYGQEHARWLSALMVAIHHDMTHGKGLKVLDLASLGQYLADDCTNYLDREQKRLQIELDQAEAAQ
ncbi:hypothetical protein ACK25U_20615 [Ectopseudomonas mendocina]